MQGLNYGDMQEAVKLYDELKEFERVVDRSDYFEDYWSISYPSLTRPNDLPPEPLNEKSFNKHFSRSQSHVSDRSQNSDRLIKERSKTLPTEFHGSKSRSRWKGKAKCQEFPRSNWKQ